MNNEGAASKFVEETGKIVSVVGNATISPTQSKWGGTSGYFDGSSYLTVNDPSLALGSGDFTVELWFFNTDTTLNQRGLFQFGGLIADTTTSFAFGVQNGTNYQTYHDGTYHHLPVGASLIAANTWHHAAVVRSGGVLSVFVDGVEIEKLPSGVVATWTNLVIGGVYSTSYLWQGYVDDVRITKGVARYTTNPTKLLLHMEQNPMWLESVSNNYLSVTGTGRVGSRGAQFDKSTYLTHTLGSAVGTGDFTAECWFYQDGTLDTNRGLFQLGGTGLSTDITNTVCVGVLTTGNFFINGAGVSTTVTAALPTDTWHHVALVRRNVVVELLVNGVALTNTTNANNFSGNAVVVGGAWDTGTLWYGNLDEFRLSNTARYTTGGDALFLPLDATPWLESNGKTVSTTGTPTLTTGKFDNGCFFNGSSWLVVSGNSSLNFGVGSWTLDLWFRAGTQVGSYPTLVATMHGGWSTNSWVLRYSHTGNRKIRVCWNPGDQFLETTSTYEAATWHHVAVVRATGTWLLVVDGVVEAQATRSDSVDFSVGLGIGHNGWDGAAGNFVGTIANVRLTRHSTALAVVSDSFVWNAESWTDATGKTVTANGAVLSSAAPKWGSTSCYMTGTNNPTVANNPGFVFDGDFTIDMWIQLSVFNAASYPYSPGNQYLFDFGANGFVLRYGSNKWDVCYSCPGGIICDYVTTPLVGVWYHIAVTRANGVVRLFVDGVVRATGVWTASLGNAGLTLGNYGGGGNFGLQGYMDGVRIVCGTALWVANFAVPTAPPTTTAWPSVVLPVPTAAPTWTPFATTPTPATEPVSVDAATTMLAHFAGTTGAVTSDETGRTIDVVGVGGSSAVSKWGTAGWWNGTSSQLTTAASPDFVLAGDFTIEGWVYPLSHANNGCVWELNHYTNGILFRFNSTTDGVYVNGANYGGITQYFPLNTWTWFAMQRRGTKVEVLVNNSVVLTFVVSGTINTNTSGQLRWGNSLHTGNHWFMGYMDEMRVTVGRALYNTGIGDVLLLHMDRQVGFMDEVRATLGQLVMGTPKIANFGKFGTGSLSVDGSSGWGLPLNTFDFGTGDFTVDFWYYQTVARETVCSLVEGEWDGGGMRMGVSLTKGLFNGLTVSVGVYGSWVTAVYTWVWVEPQVWNHVAVVRNGTTWYVFLNGVSLPLTQGGQNTGWNPAVDLSTTGSQYLGIRRLEPGATGYLDEFRSSNVARWTANFTPPTSPHTVDAATKTLCHFDGVVGGLWPNETNKTTTIVGNPQVLTTQSKWGGGSCYFDGASTLSVASSEFAMGIDDFTVECWAYPTTQAGVSQGLVQISNTVGGVEGGNSANLAILFNTAGYGYGCYRANSFWNASVTYVPNTWYHFALVRSAGVTTFYVNGESVNSVADTVNYGCGYLVLGCYYNASYYFTGYMDEVRVTRGIARWTTNFAVPTAPHIVTPFHAVDNFGNVLPPTAPWTYADNVLGTLPPTAEYAGCRVGNEFVIKNDCADDPHWSNVVLMLHMDYASGGKVIEETGKVVTVVGNTVISPTQSKWGGYSAWFDGTGSNYLTIPASQDFAFGNW